MARRRTLLPVVVGALAGAAYTTWLRPRMLTWGAHPDEIASALPGDEVIAYPALTVTRAIDIDAPPETVWPFLAQMGRGGTI